MILSLKLPLFWTWVKKVKNPKAENPKAIVNFDTICNNLKKVLVTFVLYLVDYSYMGLNNQHTSSQHILIRVSHSKFHGREG